MAEYTTNAEQRRMVRQLLCWNQQEYADYQYQCGIAYLDALTPDYPQVNNQIIKSPTFWKWWVQHWENRDAEFIEIIDNSIDGIIDPEAEYRELHDPRTLAIAIYLNGQVLQESYATMIGELTKKQKEVVNA